MLTETEKRVIISLHLQGYTGPMGSMKRQQRVKLLNSLIERGYLTERCNPTQKAIEEASK